MFSPNPKVILLSFGGSSHKAMNTGHDPHIPHRDIVLPSFYIYIYHPLASFVYPVDSSGKIHPFFPTRSLSFTSIQPNITDFRNGLGYRCGSGPRHA